MIVKVCCWCAKTSGCITTVGTYESNDDCDICDKVVGCPIAEHAHAFNAITTICEQCKKYHFPDNCG